MLLTLVHRQTRLEPRQGLLKMTCFEHCIRPEGSNNFFDDCLRRSPFLHTNHPPPQKPNCDGHRDHFGPTRVSPRCGHSCEDFDYYNYCTGGWISTNCTLRESGTQGCARPPTTSTTSSSADICQRELNRSCCCNS